MMPSSAFILVAILSSWAAPSLSFMISSPSVSIGHAVLYSSIPDSKARGTRHVTRSVKSCSGSSDAERKTINEAVRNRQWDIFMKNFQGTWVGSTSWYDRNKDSGTFDLKHPTETIESTYEIAFSDKDTGSWKGVGLRNVNGARVLSLSRTSYNLQGNVFQFPGSGGLGTCTIDPKSPTGLKHMHEVYFFDGKLGSMIMVIYSQSEDQKDTSKLKLNSIATLPFRSESHSNVNARTPHPTVAGILDQVKGWRGTRMRFAPPAELQEADEPCGDFDPKPFLSAPLSAVFADHLVLGVPEVIEPGAVEMTFGCLQTPCLFKQIDITFDGAGKLARWTYSAYQPPPV